MRVVGMISGTSFDGIDAAVADLSWQSGTVTLRPLGASSYPYDASLREDLVAAMPPRATSAEALCKLDTEIGQAFAAAAGRAIADWGAGTADLVVSHGQTLYHWVDERKALGTLQLGQPAWIAARTGLPVVADLRARDVAHGGHGAPLASMLDVLLLGDGGGSPRASLNLGGIANLTILVPGQAPIAFDTGPANALLDVATELLTDGADTFDRDGLLAAKGRVDDALLDRLLGEPYYRLQPPKSTGKELFHTEYLRRALQDRPIDHDVLATLVVLTAETVAVWCRHYEVAELVVAGGGAANPTLMAALSERAGAATVRPIDDFGLPAGDKEAYLFALLGFLTVHGQAGAIPSCTGADQAAILGSVVPGSTGLPRVDPPATAARRLVIDRS